MNDIWIQPDAGLGNRLNCIYTGLYYSRKYGKKLHIVWTRENCCNVPFEKLFEPMENVEVHTLFLLGKRPGYILRSYLGARQLKELKENMDFLDAGATRYLYIDGGEEAVCTKLEQDKPVLFMSSGPFCDIEHFAQMRREICPKKEIRDRVDMILEPYRGKRLVGIHIRRTDHQTAIDKSPVEKFTEFMDRQGEDTYFYLATDDETIRQELEVRYKLIPRMPFAKSVTRKSSDGMRDAYVEMLCLAGCECILGSFGSTFSMIAAFMGECRLDFAGQESYWNEELKINECLIASWMRN